MWEKIQISVKSDRNNGTLLEDQYKSLIISRSFLLRMKNVSDKNYRETQNTYIMFSVFFFENHAVYEIMWENTGCFIMCSGITKIYYRKTV